MLVAESEPQTATLDAYRQFVVDAVEGQKVDPDILRNVCFDAGRTKQQFHADVAIFRNRKRMASDLNARADVAPQIDEINTEAQRLNELYRQEKSAFDEKVAPILEAQRKLGARETVYQLQNEAGTRVSQASLFLQQTSDPQNERDVDEFSNSLALIDREIEQQFKIANGERTGGFPGRIPDEQEQTEATQKIGQLQQRQAQMRQKLYQLQRRKFDWRFGKLC